MSHQISYRIVSRETSDKLSACWYQNEDALNQYIDTLLDYNNRINLISRKLSRDDVVNHVLHSLVPSLLVSLPDDRMILDTGTGGGLPGIPLAILNPEKRFILHDKSTKKIDALSKIVEKLHLDNCSTLSDDLNNISFKDPVTVVSKHAFKLDDFAKRSRKINWSEALFLKGSTFTEELSNKFINDLNITSFALDPLGAFFDQKVMLHITRK